MHIKERVANSNRESLAKDKELISISELLAKFKVMIPIRENPEGKEVGYFKLVNGKLQAHVRVISGKKPIWLRFWIVDATEEEVSLNSRLNIIKKED